MAQISVSDYVKDELDDIKQKEDHTSYDSVVRVLLGSYQR